MASAIVAAFTHVVFVSSNVFELCVRFVTVSFGNVGNTARIELIYHDFGTVD